MRGYAKRFSAVAAVAALALCLASGAQASLGVTGYTGASGPDGYQPMGATVNGTGNGGVPAGTTYVSQGEGRIAQWDPSGKFVRAFGRGVVESGEDNVGPLSRIDVDATGGSYRVRVATSRAEGHINATNQVTGVAIAFGSIHVGDGIEGTGIPAGTTITAVGAETLQLSANATSTGDPVFTTNETTANIAVTAAPATVGAALDALPYVAERGGVEVDGGPGGVGATTPYLVHWGLGLNFAPETTASSGTPPLTGGAATAVVAEMNNFGPFEICNANPPSNDVCKYGFGVDAGVAVDPATGNLYVRDERSFDEFSATGEFIRSFGGEVVISGPDDGTPASAEQEIDIPPSVTGGTFTLTFGGDTTPALARNASATTVQAALEALPAIGVGNIAVGGGPGASAPFIPVFTGALAQNPEPAIAIDSTNLVGDTGAVSVLNPGASEFEICGPIDNCRPGFSGGGGGSVAEGQGGYLAVAPPGAPNAGNVIAADPNNHRVQEFTSSGEFIRAFGFDVVAAGPDNTAGGQFEECKFGDACKAGSEGSSVGQFGSSGPRGVAVDSKGAIYTVESEANFRVQKFSPQGGPVELSPSLFGGNGMPNGTGSADSPLYIAIGSADHVLVVRRFPEGATTSCPDGLPSTEEGRVQELSSDGATLLDTHLVCNGLSAISGLAYDSAHGTLSATYLGQLGTGYPLLVKIGPAEPPVVSLDSLEEISAHGIKLVGKVNPESETSFPHPTASSYQVEYKLSSDSAWIPYLQPISVGAGMSDVPVTASLNGLTPNQSYDVRLVAAKQFRQGVVRSAPQTFSTLSAAPEVSSFYTTNVSETGADLHAVINPFGKATKYHFEYGPTPSFGTSAPIPDGELPAVQGPQHVVAHVGGLNGGTYYFRVVAVSDSGVTTTGVQNFNFFPPECPNALLRQQTGASYLPDCRAYELVSAPNSGNVTLGVGGPIAPEATNPSRFPYTGRLGTIEGSGDPIGTDRDLYVATRTNGGWVTKYVGVPGTEAAGVGSPREPDDYYNDQVAGIRGSFDLSKILDWDRGQGGFECCGLEGSLAPYMWAADGSPLGRLPSNLPEIPGGTLDISKGGYIGGVEISPDFSHYFFSSLLTAFAPGGLVAAPGSAYDDDIQTGEVTLISKTAQGEDIPAGVGGSSEYIEFPAVSTDGSHILMSTKAGGETQRLYMSVDGVHHYNVSVGTDGLAHPVTYAGMTADGSTVYFTSVDQLSDQDTDSSADLYMWNEASPGEVTPLTTGNSDGCGASWTAGCGAKPILTEFKSDNAVSSRSGDVYFLSPELLVSGSGTPGQRNLYGYSGGEVHFVVTLPGDADVNRIQVTPEGDHLAFVTTAALTAQPTDGHREMYTYDPATEEIKCVSCIPSGTVPSYDVEASKNGLFMSDDGRTFFSTADALVAQDADGVIDSYEFVLNRPQLLTSGTAERGEETGFVGVSSNGVDAYFLTRETFVGQDEVGPFLKFYDARVGGGIPFDPPAAPCEAADECHGPASGPPAQLPSGTSSPLGSGGNQVSSGKGNKKKHKKAHRRRHKKQNRKRGSDHRG